MSLYKCPSGHVLPNIIPGKKSGCSPVFCLAEDAAPVLELPEELQGNKDIEQATRKDALVQWSNEAAFANRHRRIGTPDGAAEMTAEDTEQFVNKKKAELSVIAIGEAEDRLKYGTKAERWDAAKYVLDASGHGKSDKLGISMPSIVIIDRNSIANPPWAKKKSSVTVDSTATVLPEGDNAS